MGTIKRASRLMKTRNTPARDILQEHMDSLMQKREDLIAFKENLEHNIKDTEYQVAEWRKKIQIASKTVETGKCYGRRIEAGGMEIIRELKDIAQSNHKREKERCAKQTETVAQIERQLESMESARNRLQAHRHRIQTRRTLDEIRLRSGDSMPSENNQDAELLLREIKQLEYTTEALLEIKAGE